MVRALLGCEPTHPALQGCPLNWFHMILSCFVGCKPSPCTLLPAIFIWVKGIVKGFVYNYIYPYTLLVYDNCSKAEYTRLISLCMVSVPYVRLYSSMGLGYIMTGSCQSGIYGPVSLAISHHPAPCTLHLVPCSYTWPTPIMFPIYLCSLVLETWNKWFYMKWKVHTWLVQSIQG